MIEEGPSPAVATEDEAPSPASLETALASSQAAADRALLAAADLTKALKQLRTASLVGNLRDLRASLAAIERTAGEARDEARQAAASWTLDEEAYLADGRYTQELVATAEAAGLQLFDRDERIYCYPVLVRVAAGERSVFVDKTRERRLRPSVLVELLRDVQRRPPRFRPEVFLESLFSAYTFLVQRRGPNELAAGHTERLSEIYTLMTLRPGSTREYSIQEFARDIYLLDRSGATTTRRGHIVSFPASTGARSPAGSLRVVTEGGQEKVYYGIAFTPGG